MPKKRNVSVEIVRKRSPEDMKAMLDRLVRDKLEEILAERGEDRLEPATRSRRIRQTHPGFERVKHVLYFERWGCQTCGKKNVAHMSNAKCERCSVRFSQRMQQLELEWLRNNPESQIADDIDHLTRRHRTAQALLGDVE